MHKRKMILIVEDDRFLAKAYETAFEGLDCDIQLLFDGEKAIDVMKEKHPDIVLLDILLPIKDGFQILEEKQSQADIKNIPVIVASNLGQEDEITKAKEFGITDYIVKSDTSIGEIVRMLKKYL